jgi:O-succinylbenzoic acid--CoA ligase
LRRLLKSGDRLHRPRRFRAGFDRLKDMLNRGYKVFSVEVENVLAACPGVLESAIIGKPCPVLGERVHAFVSRSDPDLDEARLREFCAARPPTQVGSR